MSYDHTREIIRRIYAKHGAGCCWHVVLDDYNWHLVGHCRERARTNTDCVTEGACQELAELGVSASHIRRALKAEYEAISRLLTMTEQAAMITPSTAAQDAFKAQCERISKLVMEGTFHIHHADPLPEQPPITVEEIKAISDEIRRINNESPPE